MSNNTLLYNKVKRTASRRRPLMAVMPLCLLVLVFFTSCHDFLKESSQDKDYVRSWRDLNELLIGSAYLPDNNSSNFLSGANYGMFIHLPGDELTDATSYYEQGLTVDGHDNEYGVFTWQQRMGQNQTYTDYYGENKEWTKMYNAINVCNNIINSAEDLPQSTDDERLGYLKVTGEAHFLRAYYYFWLVNTWAKPYDPSTAATDPGVPVKTSALVEDLKFQRNTVQETYDLIVSDLKAAEQELGGWGGTQPSKYRVDSVGVHLLQSRVYLYMQNWQEAARYAQKVIDEHPALQNLNADTTSFMRTSNPENLFSMGGDDLPCMIANVSQALQVNVGLFNSYSLNDLRRTLWYWQKGSFVGSIKREHGVSTLGDVPFSDARYYYYCYTEALVNQKSPVSSVFWLRSAEAYLNLAEAAAYMGDEDVARQAVNRLRAARFVPSAADMNIKSSGNQLINDIRAERRRELALEGHRWFDLRRYRVCQVNPSKISITHDFGVYEDHTSANRVETRRFVLGQDDKSWTLPLPQEVLNFNTGMQPNENEFREYTVVEDN